MLDPSAPGCIFGGIGAAITVDLSMTAGDISGRNSRNGDGVFQSFVDGTKYSYKFTDDTFNLTLRGSIGFGPATFPNSTATARGQSDWNQVK